MYSWRQLSIVILQTLATSALGGEFYPSLPLTSPQAEHAAGSRWLPAVPGADHSHCDPRSPAYDWYELTTESACTDKGCHAHVLNYNTSNPTEPSFEEDYVLAALDLGNGRLGELGLSYFDKQNGGYAVGTRRVLSGHTESDSLASECRSAYTTLRAIRDEKRLGLPFDMIDPCSPARHSETRFGIGEQEYVL